MKATIDGIVYEGSEEEIRRFVENPPVRPFKAGAVDDGGGQRMNPRDSDLSAVSAVCDDCARTLGCTRKDKKILYAWMDECGVCHKRKLCTNLHDAWNPPKRGGAK